MNARRSPDPSTRRSSARRLLQRFLGAVPHREEAQRGRLLLEPLESRQMLAGDVEWLSTETTTPQPTTEVPTQFAASNLQAEGEAAIDLVAFATALSDAGVTFYGAAWCPHCTEQKTLFGDGKEELPFVEVTNPDRTLNSIGQAQNITQFPTWEFGDGSRATGVLSLEDLATRAGISSIPTSDQPTFAPIGDVSVEIGSPLHIPIDAYDPDSSDLTVTVTVADPSLLQATVLQNNRSARISVQNWGDMVFELFEDRAPRPTSRFIELAQAGFYDAGTNNEIIFHRVIDNFVLQAGDPTGTGSGGSTLGDFDDQFHGDLQHNRTGILSYAKSLDDTNDSQFFITEGPQRHLDFNHSIFGQLVEGDAVREAISETAVSNSKPTTDIVIDKVEIFQDKENSVVMLKPTGTATGTTQVTITVTDGDGNTFSRVVGVTITADSVNAAPFLQDIAPVTAAAGTPAVFQLNGVDAEGDAIAYEARVIDNSGATATVNQQTRQVTVTPAANFSGQILVEVAARKTTTPTSTSASTRSSTMDLQVVPVNIGPTAPTGVSLIAASDSGLSNSDRITNLAPITFTVTGVAPGATVEVLAGDTQIGVGTATGTTATITTSNFAALGNATHIVTARQTINGQASGKSPSITVVYDTVAPAQVPAVPSQATVGVAYQANLQSTEEGSGLRYTLLSGPTGLTVDSQTGQIAWTPTSSQTGDQQFHVRMTDVAGNTRDQSLTINVGSEPLVAIRLEAVDAQGNVITQLAPGQEFKIRVYGDDKRVFTPQGIFALYTDLLFDPTLAEVVSTDPFEYSSTYNSVVSGTVGTGIIEEAGAVSSQSSFLGPGERLIFSVRMRALAGGNLIVSADPAEESGHEIALFDRDDEVPVNRVQYGSVNLTVNSTFTAVNDTAVVNEDSTGNSISVLANDTLLATGTVLTISAVSSTSAQGGTVTISGDKVNYSPKLNFFGVDTFTYTVKDQLGASQTATVTVTVQAANDPPNAVNDTFNAANGSTLNRIDVLSNDQIAPDTGETLKVVAVGTPSSGGTFTIATGGTAILYTPKAGFSGTETVTYTISDGTLTDTATVTITVANPNPPPTAVNDSFTIIEDAAAADFNVLANDSNSDPTETFALSAVTPSANGTATLSSDGTRLRYQPKPNFNGVDRVTYTIRDSNGATATATATFTVTAVNDPPPAPNQTKSIVKGSTAADVLTAAGLSAVNVDSGETLTITSVGTPLAGGTVTIASGSQRVTYTPPTATFTGTDTFTYTVADGSGLTTTGTLTVEVLDYVPRDFQVAMKFDGVSYDASAFSGRLGATLSGQDYRGQAVTAEASFDPSTGKISFADQPPGTYTITLDSLPFLRNSGTAITHAFTSAASSASDVTLDADLGNLHSQYLSVRDFLSTAPTAAVFAIVAKGESHSWLIATENSSTPNNIAVRLSADGQQVTVEADNASTSGRRAATVPITSSLVDVRATSGDYFLLKINVNPSALTYSPVTSTASTSSTLAGSDTTTGGEGEAEALVGDLQVAALSSALPSAPSSSSVNYAAGTVSGYAGTSGLASANEEEEGIGFASTSGLSAEGEATPPPLTSPQTAAAQSTWQVPSAASAARTSTPLTAERMAATDSAMLDLLPQLEVRSRTAEALAEPAEDHDVASLDATFQWLADEGLHR